MKVVDVKCSKHVRIHSFHDPRIPRLWSKRTVLMRPGHYYTQHVTLVVYVLVWCALGPSW